MNLSEEKRALRRRVLERRKTLTVQECAKQDEAITKRVLNLPEYQEASLMSCYVSVGTEVDTHALICQALADGKRVAVPKCLSPGVMNFCLINDLQELEIGKYGLMEPCEKAPVVNIEKLDLAIIPAVACDEHCNRLGKGGGYYDRVLARRSFTAVALCREIGLIDELPCEECDVAVDMVVTDKAIYLPN